MCDESWVGTYYTYLLTSYYGRYKDYLFISNTEKVDYQRAVSSIYQAMA